MDELHGSAISYEIRKGNSTHKEVAFKASNTLRKGKSCDCNSDDFYTEIKLVQFVKKMKKWSKLKGKYPLICFKRGKIGHYDTKCPFKDDNDDDESKRKSFKNKGSNKKKFLSKQDSDDYDENEPNRRTFKKKSSNKRNLFSKQNNDDSDEDDDYA